MSVFDPEPADPSEPPAKKKGGRAKKSTVPKLAAPAAQAPQERDPSPDPAPKRGAAAKKEALAAAGESGSFRPDKAPIQKMLVPAIQAELIKRNHSKAPPRPPPPSKHPARALSTPLGRAGGSGWQQARRGIFSQSWAGLQGEGG